MKEIAIKMTLFFKLPVGTLPFCSVNYVLIKTVFQESKLQSILERYSFRFSSKAMSCKPEVSFTFRSKIKMAERNSVPSSPKAGNRRESTDSCHTESLTSNVEFMRLLRMVPDELRRLEHKIKKLERELNSSSSRCV